MAFMRPLLSILGILACAPPSPQLEAPPTPLDYEAIEARLEPRPDRGRTSDRFPDILLTNQHGQQFRFYEDLVKDRSVVVNFMFTQCALICPGTTSHLVRLHDAFEGAVGRDLTFLSISLDPENDTTEALHRYWKAFGGHEGWHYLRGDFEETELLRRRMGVYDLDPVVDADKTQHAGILTFGSDLSDRWAALPSLSTIVDLKETIRRFALGGKRGVARRGRARLTQPDPESKKVYPGRGTIEDVQQLRHEVVLSHEDIAGLMPAMTMNFAVSGDIDLDEFSIGQGVEFGLVNEPTGFRIVEMKSVAPRTSAR